MTEYLEREATVELLRNLGSRDYRREKGTIQEAIKMISFPEYTPAADVAPVRHGRWIVRNKGMNNWVDCSECGTIGSPHWKWCPVCGCHMDGKEETE